TTYNTDKRTDTYGLETYPVNGGSPLSLVYTSISQAVQAAAKFQQSPYANLQTFNWAQNSTQRAPTFAEYYNMAYQAIVAGAKGIINYPFYDSTTYLPNYTELWAGLQTMPAEINQLQDFFLNG